MKTLVVDCQLFQTTTLNRGMGRYALGILNAIQTHQAEAFSGYKLVGIHNTNITDQNDWQTTLKEYFPQINLVGLNLQGIDNDNYKLSLETNRHAIGEYLDELTESDEIIYFVPAILDDTIYACFPLASRPVKNILLFHDLIPYLFPDHYLQTKAKRDAYFYRLADVFKADAILCNSRTTANDLSRFLCIPHSRLEVLGSGDTNELRLNQDTRSTEVSESLLKAFRDKEFVLSVSGDDIRKNNERMVAAFDQFNRLHDNRYTLVITSNFSSVTQEKLSQQSKFLYFTGSVPSSDLEWLYQQAKATLFVPEYEGLGLPILESAKHGTPMIVSDIEVFRELSEDAVYFADYADVTSIASALHAVIIDGWKPSKQATTELQKEWSWPVVAERFLAVLQNDITSQKVVRSKPRIAILIPDTDGISSIARFVQSHHAVMDEYADVVYYLEKSPSVTEERASYLPYVAECREIQQFPKDLPKEHFDQVIYHVGNSDYHLATFQYALRYPGTLVMHDTDLRGLALVTRDYKLWDDARYQAEKKLNKILSAHSPALHFSGSVANASKKVIIHSEFAEEAVRAATDTEKPIAKQQLPMATPLSYSRPAPHDLLRVGIAGIINSSKGTDVLKMALTNPASNQGTIYHIFGYSFAADQIDLLRLYELGPVLLELNLPDLAFQNRLREMDVLLNYRPQYHGEASSATLEAMRYGVVPIVRNIGWFSHLPDTVALKVESVEEVPEAIQKLTEDRKLLHKMSEAAYQYVIDNCQTEKYVQECING